MLIFGKGVEPPSNGLSYVIYLVETTVLNHSLQMRVYAYIICGMLYFIQTMTIYD